MKPRRFATDAFAVRRVEASAEPSCHNRESEGNAKVVIEVHYDPEGSASLILDCSLLQLLSTGTIGVEFMLPADRLADAIDMMAGALLAAKDEAVRRGLIAGEPAAEVA